MKTKKLNTMKTTCYTIFDVISKSRISYCFLLAFIFSMNIFSFKLYAQQTTYQINHSNVEIAVDDIDTLYRLHCLIGNIDTINTHTIQVIITNENETKLDHTFSYNTQLTLPQHLFFSKENSSATIKLGNDFFAHVSYNIQVKIYNLSNQIISNYSTVKLIN